MKIFNKSIIILFFVSAAFISACSSSDDIVIVDADGDAVEIVTVNGLMHTLFGHYFIPCYETSTGDSVRELLTINDATWSSTADVYTGVTDCSNTPAESTLTATIIKGETIAITGWVDGPVPIAADSSAPLLDNESVTTIDFTITAKTGTFFSSDTVGDKRTIFFVADDTDADSTGFNIRLYRDKDGVVDPKASAINPYHK